MIIDDATIYCGETPCYTRPDDPCEYNPYRQYLELHELRDNKSARLDFWIADAGNGCSGGYALLDIDGWTDDDINERFGSLDLGVLRGDAAAIRLLGYADEADWLESWIERAARAHQA